MYNSSDYVPMTDCITAIFEISNLNSLLHLMFLLLFHENSDTSLQTITFEHNLLNLFKFLFIQVELKKALNNTI